MSKHWGWLLAVALTACGTQVEIAPGVALKHGHSAGFQQQVKLLAAEQVKVSVTTAGRAGPAAPRLLTLEVINPHSTPEHPDTLKQRLRKLARLLVADLASPASYQVVSAQATFRRSLFSPRNSSSSQAFIYPIASLR
ncbi:hypothetical protein GKZ68_18040 [Hymenobacter sp. BRD128]|uniref:hypothetical protein n=1 Tax=Hymenobacter sp. BRD128 TaxID=2675878 RepID=UPI0015648237|nr:hypothetical protein [Hymenobacter sp. BRD128]QKG58362.1 hypothetical protein GKZ68_18040 [Hymenobacter sp. BRD128]